MPKNYNFKENWYEVIVPLLNTVKVKNAIKKGVLGYMNNSVNPDIKFSSYKHIYDYFNDKNGECYFNKNSSPADYSSFSVDHQMDWEDTLIDTLEQHNMIKPFTWDNYDDEKKSNTNPELEYEEYRDDYLDPILEPFINNYKKTHIDSYCLRGGCHWWNPTFCLTLANIVMPNEKWRPKSSEYHTTIVNSDNTKIFDILYFNEYDVSFGGDLAYENSSMTLDEIRERNTKENTLNREKKVNHCPQSEIYNTTFNHLYDDLNEIEANITKMETTLEGFSGLFLNKTYDDEEKGYTMYKFEQTIIDELFPNAMFDICIDYKDLHTVITTKKKVKLIQTFDCYCYSDSIQMKNIFVIQSTKPMTRRYIINELIKQDFKLECNHYFLESIDVNNDGIIEWYAGS